MLQVSAIQTGKYKHVEAILISVFKMTDLHIIKLYTIKISNLVMKCLNKYIKIES